MKPVINLGAGSLLAELPYPPTTNHAYAVRRGRLVKTDAARAYATDVQAVLLEHNQLVKRFKKHVTGDSRFEFRIDVHPPDLRRRDLGNVEKLVTDAVFAFIGVDDSRIDSLVLNRGPVWRDGGRLYATLSILEEEVK